MIRLSAPLRAAAKWKLVACAVAALGCRVSPSLAPAVTWSTTLPPGVNSDAAAFRAQVAAFVPTGRVHSRPRAASCFRCAVEVTIEALGDTRTIDPNNAPAMGVAVARIENLDETDTEARYGFRPRSVAVYYLWVDRKPGSIKARWTVLQVPAGAGTVTAGHQKDLRACHVFKPDYSDADFYEFKHRGGCTVTSSVEKSAISEASLISTERLSALLHRIVALARGELAAAQGGWISCSDGCCT